MKNEVLLKLDWWRDVTGKVDIMEETISPGISIYDFINSYPNLTQIQIPRY